MKKNDILKGIITDIGSNGEGIIKIEDKICFVPFAFIGENVEFKVLKVNKNVAFCKLLSVIKPSKNRVEPLCPYFFKCGGCQLQHVLYSEQLSLKNKTVKNCLKKIAFLDLEVLDVFPSNKEYYYRNKLILPVRQSDGKISIGFFKENSHRVCEIDNCVIENEFLAPLFSVVKNYINQAKISAYNEENGTGIIRHIVARNCKGKLLLTIVINDNNLPRLDILVDLLKKEYTEFSVIQNVNKVNNNVVLGEEFKVLYGSGVYYSTDFDIKYPIVSQSFMQVNDFVKENLYLDVLNKLNPDSNSVVIDGYSGAGVMTAILAKNAKKAIGIEIIKEAVESADILKEENGLKDKMLNILGDCGEVLPKIIEEERKNANNLCLVLDPPRKGCDKRVIDAVLKSLPDKICYVSCSPQTLARDLGLLLGTLKYEGNNLVKTGKKNDLYEINYIRPYDMFPQTKHVESLVCLSRK